MTGVFALAAAMCLQAYAMSYNLSKLSLFREEATSMADAIKESVLAGEGFVLEGIEPYDRADPYATRNQELRYGADWKPCEARDAAYVVRTMYSDPYPLPYMQCVLEIAHPDGRVYASRDIVIQLDLPEGGGSS